MDRKYIKYMDYMSRVTSNKTGSVYHILEDMKEDKDSVISIEQFNYDKYRLLKLRYDITDEQKELAKTFEEELMLSDIEPTSGYISVNRRKAFNVKIINSKGYDNIIAGNNYIVEGMNIVDRIYTIRRDDLTICYVSFDDVEVIEN